MTRCTAAMVLTAGRGTRLLPLTTVRAKAAVPIGGEPLIRRIMKWLISYAVTDIVLNLHHLPETIAAVVGDASDLGARVRYSWEQPVILGSAGGVRQALPILGHDTFLVSNGDTLTDVDLAGLGRAHRSSGALVTMALVRGSAQYGGVRLDHDGGVVGFTRPGQSADAYHFVGTQMVESRVFSALGPGQPAASVGGVYDALIAERPGSIRGFVSDAAFWDVGTVADYWSTSWAFANRLPETDTIAGRRANIAGTARVSGSLLWDDVIVCSDAVLEACLVTDGVTVPAGAIYRDAILMRGPDGTLQVFPRLTR
jgi:NDP-sugar pyrophosphorylase family protein